VLFKQWVSEVVWREGQVLGTLNDGVVRREQVHRGVFEVAASELGAAHRHLTIRAIPEEDGRLNWTNVENSTFAFVDVDLRDVVEKENGAVLQVLDFKVNSIDVSWPLDKNLSFLVLQNEVSSVELLLLGCWRNLF